MFSFKNSLLIIVFNYSSCINNKIFLKDLYSSSFKQIFFYSDYPVTNDDEVHYLDISQGCFVHKVFHHLYENYNSAIQDSSGLFYTMDDNIINLNILNLYDDGKIIYYYKEIKSLTEYSGWQWDNETWGKPAIEQLMRDERFQQYHINQFSGSFADWFYLPKKYLTTKLFDLFDLFSSYHVFMELAIPSIIHNIETDKFEYQYFTDEVLWNYDDRKKLDDKNHVLKCFHHDHHLILHPLKFNHNPESKKWLQSIFCKEKCIVITTIYKPTDAIMKHIQNVEYDVIIVGDLKTPDDEYKKLDCIYLDVSATLVPIQIEHFGFFNPKHSFK